MRTLTNTQINKITNVVYNVLETKFKERNIDMSNLKMIDKEFNKICNELENELEDNVQDQFENEISFENVKLTIKNIEECVKQCLFDTDSNYQNFQELVKIGLDEEDEDEEEDEEDEEDEDEEEDEEDEDENGNVIVISSNDVYDYDYNSIIRDFNDSYFHNQILKVDNLDKKDEENADFLFKGLHLNFDNTCSILTLQTSANYKETLIDNRIEEINFDTNNHKNFYITTEQLKEIFFEEFDRRYELDTENFEEIYEYSYSKIVAVLEFLENEIEEKVEERNEKEKENEEETEVYFEQERMYKNSKSTSKMFKNKVSYLSKNLKICGVVLDIDSQLGVENQIETYIKSNHNVKNLKLVRVVDLRQKEIELKK